jgi:hypothetical protein
MLVGTAKNPIPKRFCRKFLRMLSVGWRWTQLCCELGKLLECVQSIVVELPLSDHVAVSIPVMVAQAEWKALKPIIGPVIRFINRRSCSRIVFRYLIWRISTVRPLLNNKSLQHYFDAQQVTIQAPSLTVRRQRLNAH